MEEDDYDADFGADIQFMTPSTISSEEFEPMGMRAPQEDLGSAFSTLRLNQDDIPTLRASASHRHIRNKLQQDPSSAVYESFDDAFSGTGTGTGLNLQISQEKRQGFRQDDMHILLEEEDFDDESSLGIRRGHKHSPSATSTTTTTSSGTFDSENDDYDSVLGFGPADTSNNNNISLRQIRDAKVQKYHLETERLRAARLAEDHNVNEAQELNDEEEEDYSQYLAIEDKDPRLTIRARGTPFSSLAGTMRVRPALSITRQQQRRRTPLSGSMRHIPSVARLGQSFAGGGPDMFHDDNNALLTSSARRSASSSNQQQQQQRLRNVSSMYQLRTPSMSRTSGNLRVGSSTQLPNYAQSNLTGSLRAPRRYTRPPNRRDYFGDGSELDDIADLPIRNEHEFLVTAQSTPRGNGHHRHSYGYYSNCSEDRTPRASTTRMSRNTGTTAVPLSRRASRAELRNESSTLNNTNSNIGGHRRRKKRRTPQLIRRLGDNGPEDVNGMRFNKELSIWEGNEGEIDLFEFDNSDLEDGLSTIRPRRSRQKSHRQPALISNMNANKAVHIVGNMLFDPEKRCWIKLRSHPGGGGEEGDDGAGFDEDNEDDPFDGIEDMSEDQLSIESQERLAEARAAGRRRKDMQHQYSGYYGQEKDNTLNANEQLHHRPLPRLRSIDPNRVPISANGSSKLGQRASCSVIREGITTPTAFQLSNEFRQQEFCPNPQFANRLNGWLIDENVQQEDMRITRMKQLVDSLMQSS